ncbi:MAG: hypothetical protein ABEJ26_13505 [Halosimplex sp.]
MNADRAGATLVYESAFETRPRDRVARTLDDPDVEERPVSALAVLFRGDVDRWMDALRGRERRLSSAAVVGVGPATGAATGDHEAVRVVSDPSDLTGVCIAVSEWLDARCGEHPVVCLDSLSTVLQYADPERTFRFVHALTAQFRSHDARAIVTVDPGAHDDSTLATLGTLFDDVRGSATTAADGRPAATDSTVRSDASGRAVATDGGDAPFRGSEPSEGASGGPE